MEAPKQLKLSIKLKAPSASPPPNPAQSSIPPSQTSARKKRTISNSPKQTKKRKTPLSVCLQKLITFIRQKDTYGFFLNPVDPTFVPDYRKIITEPMDLGTMKEKVAKRAYKSGEEFQNDFELIIRNAKIYNSPDTVYFKSAEKLYNFGIRLIEKEIPGIIPDPEVDVIFDEISSIPFAPKIAKPPEPSAEVIQQSFKEEEPKRRQAKKIKHCDDLENIEFEKFNPDGTMYFDPEQASEPEQKLSPYELFASSYPRKYLNGLHIQDINAHKYWNIASSQTHPNSYTAAETEALFLTYGDLRGEAYVKSIERFTQGLDREALGISKKLTYMTRGTLDVVAKTKQMMHDQTEPGFDLIEYRSQEFECGKVDIMKRIEYCKGDSDRLAEVAEAEMFRKQGASNAFCLQPRGHEQTEPQIISPVLFEQVKNDLVSLINNPNDLEKESKLDAIRKRLWSLAVYSRDPELKLINQK